MTNEFRTAANDLTSWNASVAERTAEAAVIAERGLARGFQPNTSFEHAASADECASRIGRWVQGDARAAVYGRIGNPNVWDLEDALAVLEPNTKLVRAASTGMAAVRALIEGTVATGDHVVASRHVFGAATATLNRMQDRFGIQVTYIDGLKPEEWADAVKRNTKLFFFETPANPLLHLVDIAAVAKIAHEKDIFVGVDGSMTGSLPQHALRLGADGVALSITKWISGGSFNGGVALISQEGVERMHRNEPSQNSLDGKKNLVTGILKGADALSPANAFHFLNELKNYGATFQRHSDTAYASAQHLADHGVHVLYPGLKTHPQFDLAQKQMLKRADGAVIAGGIFAVDLQNQAAAFRAQDVLLTYGATPETNFGQPAFHVTHQATNTYVAYSQELRASCNIGDGLLRLSPGLGDRDYLRVALSDAFGIEPLTAPARRDYIANHAAQKKSIGPRA